MSDRSADILLTDILDSAQKIFRYTEGLSFDDFCTNELIVDAVIRNFEVIGEAANRLPFEFKELHPDIDWHKIRGFRNRIVHDYAGVDLNIVWVIRETFLKDMIQKISQIIKPS